MDRPPLAPSPTGGRYGRLLLVLSAIVFSELMCGLLFGPILVLPRHARAEQIAQTDTAEQTTRTDTTAYTMRGFDPRLQHGIDLIYNLHYDEAEAFFQNIIQADPDNPLGYFFRAMVWWWRVLVDLEDTSHDQTFYQRLEECIAVCDRRLKEDPEDFDAILFKGGAIGFRGRLRGDRDQYLRAANDGRRCLPLLAKSRKLEPTNKDILFGQGIYNYFAQVIPQRHPVVRPAMWFLPDGDRELGIRQLEQVATQGLYARAEAAYFLAQIYRIFENDDARALPYLEELYRRYPRNALFHRYLARTLAAAGDGQRSALLYAQVASYADEGRTGYHDRAQLEALYYQGKRSFYLNDIAAAETFLLQADKLGQSIESDRGYTALANLLLGMCYDLRGERDQALERYAHVRQLPDAKGSRDLAKKYQKTPYPVAP
jgi:hypothetical protein